MNRTVMGPNLRAEANTGEITTWLRGVGDTAGQPALQKYVSEPELR